MRLLLLISDLRGRSIALLGQEDGGVGLDGGLVSLSLDHEVLAELHLLVDVLVDLHQDRSLDSI